MRIINIEWCPLIRQFTGQDMDGDIFLVQKCVILENIQNGFLKKQREGKNLFFLEEENRCRDIEDLPADENLLFEGDIPWVKEEIWTREEFEQVKIRLQNILFVEY